MVPLPLHTQLRVNERIIGRQISLLISLSHIRLFISSTILRHIHTIITDDGPSVHPLHRFQTRASANRTACAIDIPEEDGPPFACLRLNQRTLVNVLMFEHASVVLFVRSHRILGAEDGLAPLRSSIRAIKIVVVANMVHMGAFATISHAEHFGTADFRERLWIHLVHPDVTNTTCNIEEFIAILTIVEKPPWVVITL